MNSYRRIFRSSVITAGASVINIVIGIVKVKALAILLGPAGVGLMGLYQNFLNMVATLVACGVGSSGVRQIAATSDDIEVLSLVRRALFYGNLMLGCLGMLVLWCFSSPIASFVFDSSQYTNEVGLLGVGVFLTLIAGSQTALLQGLRRIGDLARIKIGSAAVAAAVGIALVYWLGEQGVVWFVVAAPAGSVIVASYYARKLPRPEANVDWFEVRMQWIGMVRLGIPLMLATLLTLITQLAVRMLINDQMGLEAVGHLQAVWTISMTYIGFVLGAMGADFYPRLTAIIDDHLSSRNLVNQQVEMSLLIACPILLALLVLAPWVIVLLYSSEFLPVVNFFHWQVLGDLFKVCSWPIYFLLLSSGQSGIYLLIQIIWNSAFYFLASNWVGDYGLQSVGMSYVVSNVLILLILFMFTKRSIGFIPSLPSLIYFVVVLIGVVSWLGISATLTTEPSYLMGGLFFVLVSFSSVLMLNQRTSLLHWVKSKAKRIHS